MPGGKNFDLDLLLISDCRVLLLLIFTCCENDSEGEKFIIDRINTNNRYFILVFMHVVNKIPVKINRNFFNNNPLRFLRK